MSSKCSRTWWCRAVIFFFSSRRRHTRLVSDWSSDVCSSDLRVQLCRPAPGTEPGRQVAAAGADDEAGFGTVVQAAQRVGAVRQGPRERRGPGERTGEGRGGEEGGGVGGGAKERKKERVRDGG